MDKEKYTLVDLLDDDLMERRTILFRGEVTAKLARKTNEQLFYLQCKSSEPIHLLIDSGGGSVMDALRIADYINHLLTAPVHATVIGDCFSAASLVLLHCSVRVCLPNALFLIHSPTQRIDVSLPVNENIQDTIRQLHLDTTLLSRAMMQTYRTKLNLSQREVLKLLKRGDQSFDNLLTADEAVRIGLVQAIVRGKLDILAF